MPDRQNARRNYSLSWWNVENLFDVESSQQRPDYLQSRLASELRGWDADVLDRKLNQLATVIKQLNGDLGPDILGVCEVENRRVLEMLAGKLSSLGRRYGLAHHDMSDNRGIDIAFFYDEDLFEFEGQFSYEVLKRSATRDLFQVNLRTADSNPLIVIGNHWPARSGGIYESEPYRIMAGETLSYWMERIVQIRGRDIPVVVMGDFNDECFNRSLVDYAQSTNSLVRTRNARMPRLYNLMWPVSGEGIGSYYYDNFPCVIDQFMVSRGLLLNNAPLSLGRFAGGNCVTVEKFPGMVGGGQYPAPIRFGRPASSPYNPMTGYSDHYPISMIIAER